METVKYVPFIGGVMPAGDQVPSPQFDRSPAQGGSEASVQLVLDGFLRRKDLAKQLGVSPRTIDRWEALRQGPPRVRVGRTILYSIQSARYWLLSIEFRGSADQRHRHSSAARSGRAPRRVLNAQLKK